MALAGQRFRSPLRLVTGLRRMVIGLLVHVGDDRLSGFLNVLRQEAERRCHFPFTADGKQALVLEISAPLAAELLPGEMG